MQHLLHPLVVIKNTFAAKNLNFTNQYLEMGGISRDGYGLLSPTILPSASSPMSAHLLLGIVPDKLSGKYNYEMGWAHNYWRQRPHGHSGYYTHRPLSPLRLEGVRLAGPSAQRQAAEGVLHPRRQEVCCSLTHSSSSGWPPSASAPFTRPTAPGAVSSTSTIR